MYPDSWIYRGFTSCNFDVCWKQNGGQVNDLRKIHGFRLLIYAQTALVWNSTTRFCNATSNFDKCHDILCLRAEFAAKHTKAPSPLTTRWKTWPGFWLMAVARYIALPLISRYLSMDPTNRDISGLHCISPLLMHWRYYSVALKPSWLVRASTCCWLSHIWHSTLSYTYIMILELHVNSHAFELGPLNL